MVVTDMLPDEHLEPLGGGLQLVVSPAHGFSIDSLLLADFAAIRKTDKACDLGTGCGIIPLLWCKGDSGPVAAVELQEKACSQLKKSLALNGLEDRVTVVHGDLREKHPSLPFGFFDLVTMNPPYYAAGTGKQSHNKSVRAARHETTCTLDDASEAAARLLCFGGRFCLCQKPERLTDVLCTLRDHHLEPKRIRFAAQTAQKTPFLVLVEARLGGKPGVNVEAPLFLESFQVPYSD